MALSIKDFRDKMIMKTFEELQECIRSINEMEEIFKSVVVIVCHQKKIQKYLDLKSQVLELLVKDRPGSWVEGDHEILEGTAKGGEKEW